ncbi:MAG: UpxY family transcription antiterminator [Ferruginibacter sp.]
MNDEKKWYVIYTRPRWEKKVASLFQAKGIEHYCPLNRVMKQWSDRKKIVFEPLFKGYIFVKVRESVKWDIKSIEGVINFVYWLGKPAQVKEEEINTIRKFLQEFDSVEIKNKELIISSKVLVKQGVLMNFRGIVVQLKGNKAIVNIESMGLELSAVFDKKNLQPV